MTGVPVARLLGIEVRLQLGWVLVVAIVAALAAAQVADVDPEVNPAIQWLLGAVVAGGFLVSALAHDLSHALVARRRGVEVKSVLISFFGGATPMDPASPDPKADLAIALAGPIVSLVLGGGLALAAVAIGATGSIEALVAAQVLAVLAVLNLVLGGVNLVPAYPLDGGRIVRDIAWRRGGTERGGWRAASTSGRVVAMLTIVVGLAILLTGEVTNGAMVALSGWFLLLSSRAIRERVKVEELIGDLRVTDVMERDTATVHPGLTVDTFAAQLLDGETPTTAIPVVQDEQVVGLLGVRQVRRLRPAAWPETRVETVMAKPPRLPMLGPDEALVSAVDRLQRSGLDGLPVVREGRLLGVLTRRSIGLAVQSRISSGPDVVPDAPPAEPGDR
ncbi:MAG: CBS domain-containing protein [Chloroflexi bacterium]|nr:CBS domain-containing protein [Chloroflexota bacterium]